VADLNQRLTRGLAALGLRLDAGQRECLIAFLLVLTRWNRAYNLTAVRDPAEMVPRHLLDSLALDPYLGGSSVLDLGTGAGLPGIPLAIAHPTRRFVLLDSSGKKVRFVRQAILELGLGNVEAVQARMESYRPAEKFATIVSRAVTSLARVSAVASPLLDRPGRLLVMKGRYPEEEIAALTTTQAVTHRLAVPFLDGERHLIEIRFD
jgi:16S rRNA (guanine527-N7)-methyltransferase